MKINDEILSILAMCLIKENVVYLPQDQLDRKIYLEVNKHLEHLGGKWNRKAKGHVFDNDPADSFENMLLTGETTDFKKEFQFFETPAELAEKMIEMAEIKTGESVLEPSAGQGAILDCFPRDMLNIFSAMEINDINYKILKKNGYEIAKQGDFLKVVDPLWFSTRGIDKIIMNPPFTKQQDIDHILHAHSLLNSGGTLVSVVSESPFFRENKKSVAFREFLAVNNAEVIKLPEGTFKASGTMVRTRLIKIINKK